MEVITAERPDTAEASLLIDELEAYLASFYPRESRHGLNVDQLLVQAVAFFVLRSDGVPAGCGGVKLEGAEYGEIKRMYVRPQFQGRGFGRLMLNHLTDYARAHGIGLLRLETGVHSHEAIGLYEQMGFQRIPAFGAYRGPPLPLSVFFEKRLA